MTWLNQWKSIACYHANARKHNFISIMIIYANTALYSIWRPIWGWYSHDWCRCSSVFLSHLSGICWGIWCWLWDGLKGCTPCSDRPYSLCRWCVVGCSPYPLYSAPLRGGRVLASNGHFSGSWGSTIRSRRWCSPSLGPCSRLERLKYIFRQRLPRSRNGWMREMGRKRGFFVSARVDRTAEIFVRLHTLVRSWLAAAVT